MLRLITRVIFTYQGCTSASTYDSAGAAALIETCARQDSVYTRLRMQCVGSSCISFTWGSQPGACMLDISAVLSLLRISEHSGLVMPLVLVSVVLSGRRLTHRACHCICMQKAERLVVTLQMFKRLAIGQRLESVEAWWKDLQTKHPGLQGITPRY
jgi:hypothetical protein